jgi:hypothetical protein
LLNIVEFKEFLIEAKKNTYAGQGEITASSRPLSKDLPYQKGAYYYLDSYLGDINFIGEEAVWLDNKAVWGMNYYGEMLVENIPENFSKCLKGALSAVPYDAPYRGPESFSYGDLEYRCEWNGDIGSFYGEESILSGRKVIYKLRFHGGFISSFN